MNIEPKPVTEWPNPVYSIGIDHAFAQDDYDYIDNYMYRIDDNRMAVVVFADMDSAESFCKDANERHLTECPLVVVEESLRESYRSFSELLSRLWQNEPKETPLVWMSPTSPKMPRDDVTFYYAEAVLAWLHEQMPHDDRYPELTKLWDGDKSN